MKINKFKNSIVIGLIIASMVALFEVIAKILAEVLAYWGLTTSFKAEIAKIIMIVIIGLTLPFLKINNKSIFK